VLYSSGTWKLLIYFNASLFHQCRVVVYYTLNTTAVNWQNCYHQVYDIKGPTIATFSVPYINPTVMTQFGKADGVILMQVLGIVVNGASPTINPITAYCYLAGDSDWKFSGILDTAYQTSVTPTTTYSVYNYTVSRSKPKTSSPLDYEKVELHSNIRELFKRKFEPLHPDLRNFEHDHVVAGDNITSMADFYKKFNPYYVIGSDSAVPNIYQNAPLTVTGDTHYYSYGLEKIARFYRFHRGSVKIKLYPANQTVTVPKTAAVYSTSQATTLAFPILSSSVNPVMDFTMPHLYGGMIQHNGSAFLGADYVIDMTENISIDTPDYFFLCKAGGDDFTFQWLCPPPSGAIVNINQDTLPGIGVTALQFFTNTDF